MAKLRKTVGFLSTAVAATSCVVAAFGSESGAVTSLQYDIASLYRYSYPAGTTLEGEFATDTSNSSMFYAGAGNVWKINPTSATATAIASLPATSNGNSLEVDPVNHQLWVGNDNQDGTITVFNENGHYLSSVLGNFGRLAQGVDTTHSTPTFHSATFSQNDSMQTYVISSEGATQLALTSGLLDSVDGDVFDPQSQTLYVAATDGVNRSTQGLSNCKSGGVMSINSTTGVIKGANALGASSSLVFDAANHRLYLGSTPQTREDCSAPGVLTVMSSDSLQTIATVTLANGAAGPMVLDSSAKRLLVSEPATATRPAVIEVFSTVTGARVATLTAPGLTVVSMSMAPSGHQVVVLASATSGNTVELATLTPNS